MVRVVGFGTSLGSRGGRSGGSHRRGRSIVSSKAVRVGRQSSFNECSESVPIQARAAIEVKFL